MRFGPLGPLTAALLMGCAGGSTLAPGRATEADVRAVMGEPLETRRGADGETLLWYSLEIPDRAYGRGNYAARIAPDGRLISLEQRLNDVNIAKLLPDVSRAEDVRDALGRPRCSLSARSSCARCRLTCSRSLRRRRSKSRPKARA